MKTPARPLRSPLGRVAAKAPANLAEMWSMRRRAWRESGVLVLRPEELTDDFARQALINAATRLFGERPRYPEPAQPSQHPSSPARKEPTP
jgi:hypothetical protein